MKKIYLGADHAGFHLKEKLKRWLEAERVPFEDCGDLKYDKNDDYPDYAAIVAKKVVKSKSKGILLCGSAEGVCIAANKIKGIRAVNPYGVIQAEFSRRHEDANILCLAGGESRVRQPALSLPKAKTMILTFLNTPFSGAVRHVRRINKIKRLER
ncbi:ribose-5-phosphate isomerase [Candidatus Woesearchaeota archaeon CG10_big_fil_rev_8_21_14_0_10_45_16]|nr:MAG: ribose-5-phosphate isomerase [Candidatus Woesearchaeota archaeon CG10_big_fil_rev_8_21_14_0_10_45_16]